MNEYENNRVVRIIITSIAFIEKIFKFDIGKEIMRNEKTGKMYLDLFFSESDLNPILRIYETTEETHDSRKHSTNRYKFIPYAILKAIPVTKIGRKETNNE